jgi:hypothetical protein
MQADASLNIPRTAKEMNESFLIQVHVEKCAPVVKQIEQRLSQILAGGIYP